MANDLLHLASVVLGTSTNDPALRAVAAEALLVGLVEGLTLPVGAIRSIWGFWISHPSRRGWRHSTYVGAIDDPVVREQAIEILTREDSGDDLRDLATDILTGEGHRQHLTDPFLLRLFERANSANRAREVQRLIEGAHDGRVVSTEILRGVRDRFASSSTAGIRDASISIGGLISEPDIEFVTHMLADPDAEVRCSMAQALDVGHPGHELCLPTVEARIRVETHYRVRLSLLRCQASLLEAIQEVEDHHPRRRRGRR